MTVARLAAILVIGSSILAVAQSQPESSTGIEGLITIGPVVAGPVREGQPSSAPLANATFTVTNEKGALASFTTDVQGRFRVLLIPGHYQIAQQGKTGIRRCGPFDVDVVTGKMATVEWECDTGMR
jgi:hypothetical protein